MAYFTVSEQWHLNHTHEFRIRLHVKLDEMQDQGKFIRNTINNDRSVYDTRGRPTKIFSSEDAVNEYINWLKVEHSNIPMRPGRSAFNTTINKFETENELNNFLNSINDINFEPTVLGPTTEEELNYKSNNDSN